MALEMPVRSDWKQQVIATRTARGQVFLLLAVRKTECEICRYGVRFETTWASTTGDVNRLAWCRSCFNADCAAAELDEGLRRHWRGVMLRAALQPPLDYWTGARSAIDDLERRGLV